MEWRDDAFVLSARRHGESGAIVSLLTRDHGRHAGFVRGGGGRRQRGFLQMGNRVRTCWRGRLPDQLGSLTCELTHATSAAFLADAGRLAALTAACAVADTALPEREPVSAVYDGLLQLFHTLGQGGAWPAAYVRWELALLSAIGYGLDLSISTPAGTNDPPAFVSPATGRALPLSAGAGEGDAANDAALLVLPAFLAAAGAVPAPSPADIAAGLAVTAHFLVRHVYDSASRPLPAARRRLAERFTARPTAASTL
jgi:DNA repair protein RecO (recombination protein O)